MSEPGAKTDPDPPTERGAAVESGSAFSEKAFYLAEFRGRTLGLALSSAEQAHDRALLSLLDELRSNDSRVVVVAPPGVASDLECEALSAAAERLEARVWRQLRRRGRVVIEVAPPKATAIAPGTELFATVQRVARRLALFKVVLLTDSGGYRDHGGRRHSFVDLVELEQLLAGEPPPEVELLREVRLLLAAGVPNVNLCTVEGLHDELFTYSGSGTLFTRHGYIGVRPLGIDDYDSADDLITRGVAEGFLAPRDEAAIDRLLPHCFGAFVEDEHLAGLGALLLHEGENCGEIASLYAVTRFLGEGVGAHLVRFAVDRARTLGLDYVYACTASKRAGEFFRHLGFAPVEQDRVPAEKWRGYDPERRARVGCYRLEL